MFPGMNGLDPSKMSPEVIAEISSLMQTLSGDQIMKMQSLMHNSMAGFNVTAEMAAFEQTLPAGFREKMARIMYMANGIAVPPATNSTSTIANVATSAAPAANPENVDEARLVILKSVANGLMSPEDAVKVLFP